MKWYGYLLFVIGLSVGAIIVQLTHECPRQDGGMPEKVYYINAWNGEIYEGRVYSYDIQEDFWNAYNIFPPRIMRDYGTVFATRERADSALCAIRQREADVANARLREACADKEKP